MAVNLDSSCRRSPYNVPLGNLTRSSYTAPTTCTQKVRVCRRTGAAAEIPLYDKMTVSDLIFLAGNLTESAYMLSAELARIDSLGASSV